MKKLLLFFVLSFATASIFSTIASAQEKEKVVTGTVAFLSPGNTKFLDEYIADHLYSGNSASLGLNVKFGALYKKHDYLSWDFYYTSFTRPNLLDRTDAWKPLSNPANSQYLKLNSYNFGYGTYYHWYIAEKLMIKTGGMFDLYGAMKQAVPDAVNNATNLEGQMMLKAHGAIKYGWDFKKWSLDIHGSVTLPLVGIITADHPSEPAVSIIGANDHSVLNPVYRHIYLGSYHNFMSLDYEAGIDFVIKPCTFTLAFGSSCKWWKVNSLQNIRIINYTSFGVSFDIVSRDKIKSSNRIL